MSSTTPQPDDQQNPQQAARDAASPSPPPPAPVAVTPGPRASRLQKVFSEALARTLRANSYANFAACFPTPAKHVPASLESVWRQLNAKLEESAKAEFDDIIRERDAIRGLNELDRLVGEARLRRENGEGQNTVAYVSLAHFVVSLFSVFLWVVYIHARLTDCVISVYIHQSAYTWRK